MYKYINKAKYWKTRINDYEVSRFDSYSECLTNEQRFLSVCGLQVLNKVCRDSKVGSISQCSSRCNLRNCAKLWHLNMKCSSLSIAPVWHRAHLFSSQMFILSRLFCRGRLRVLSIVINLCCCREFKTFK